MYKRKIDTKVYFLRILFAVLLSTIIYLFKSGFPNYGYFFSVLFLTIGIIAVKGVEIDTKKITVTSYRFFGLIPFIKRFNSDYIQQSSLEIELTSDEDAVAVDTEHWWDIFLILLPMPNAKIKMYRLKEIDSTGKHIEAKISLTPEELELISKKTKLKANH